MLIVDGITYRYDNETRIFQIFKRPWRNETTSAVVKIELSSFDLKDFLPI